MSEQPKQMPAKCHRWPRIILVVFLVFIALYAGYRYTLHRMVEAKLHEIRKQGYPVTLAELDKWYPQVPKEENSAEVYLEAFKHLPERHKSDTNLPIVGDAKLPPRTAPLPPEMQQAVEGYLAANREALNLLHEAAAKHACRYPVSLSNESERFKFHLGDMRQGIRLLYLEAFSAAASGDAQGTTEAVAASVALTKSLKDRSVLISYLVEQACLGLTVSSLEQALSRTAFTEQQLAELSDAFHQVGTADWFTHAVIGERA